MLTELGKILPFGDRRIDVVIESHPDADHIGGLRMCLTDMMLEHLEPGVKSPNNVHLVLEKKLKIKYSQYSHVEE